MPRPVPIPCQPNALPVVLDCSVNAVLLVVSSYTAVRLKSSAENLSANMAALTVCAFWTVAKKPKASRPLSEGKHVAEKRMLSVRWVGTAGGGLLSTDLAGGGLCMAGKAAVRAAVSIHSGGMTMRTSSFPPAAGQMDGTGEEAGLPRRRANCRRTHQLISMPLRSGPCSRLQQDDDEQEMSIIKKSLAPDRSHMICTG